MLKPQFSDMAISKVSRFMNDFICQLGSSVGKCLTYKPSNPFNPQSPCKKLHSHTQVCNASAPLGRDEK